jgi:sugar lactone lactonase YvrE
VAVDSAGDLYVADTGNSTIRKITPAGVVTTLAGIAGVTGSTDGTGNTARFSGPLDVAVDRTGTVYVADTDNATIRKITPAGVVTTLAGTAGMTGSANGTGAAARFEGPSAVAVDRMGNLHVADPGNASIRKVTADGVVTTLAGTADAFIPTGVAVDAAGIVYFAEKDSAHLHRITPGGVHTVVSDVDSSLSGPAPGLAARSMRLALLGDSLVLTYNNAVLVLVQGAE